MSDIAILIVEDEPDLRDLLSYHLKREGMRVLEAATGENGLAMARAEMPDLVILDLMLPGIDGLSVCRALREDAATASLPVIMLTAKGEETDIVVGLEIGADDYLIKPFSPRVLLARIRSVIRRSQAVKVTKETESVIQRGELVIDPQRHEVKVAGSGVELSAGEFKLLRLLAMRPGRVFTRSQIIDALHGNYAAVTERSIDVLMVSLRRKLGSMGEILVSVRGVGYKFRD